MFEPLYQRSGDDLIHEYKLGTNNVVRYSARNIRREATGIHARISIAVNHVTLAWSNFNIERDEDRVRMANSAYKAWGKGADVDQTEWPATHMKKGLDIFSEGLWDEVVKEDRGELMEGDPDLPPATLLLANHVVEGGGSIIFAPPGRGKSYTAMLMAVSLDAGVETLWRQTYGPRRVGYINLERSRTSMQRRLSAVNHALGLDPRRPLPFVNARGRTLRDILEAAVDTFREYKVEVAVLDSISRMGYGDLTADKTSNAAMDDLNRYFPTWVALGHTPRKDETHTFGSQMFDAAADIAIQLSAQTTGDEMATGISLQVTKANDTPKGSALIHVLEWGSTGLTGVRAGRAHEFPELEAGRPSSVTEEIAEFLRMVGTATGSEIADTLQRNRPTVAEILKADTRFEFDHRQGVKVYYRLK